MSKPLVVSIPHQLGKAEAVLRLKAGLSQARNSFSGAMTVSEENWNGDHLDFRFGLLGQSVAGTLDVADDNVRLEVQLPWLLARLADKAKGLLQRQTQLMLEKK